MKKLLAIMLTINTASLASNGQDTFLKKVEAYLNKVQSREGADKLLQLDKEYGKCIFERRKIQYELEELDRPEDKLCKDWREKEKQMEKEIEQIDRAMHWKENQVVADKIRKKYAPLKQPYINAKNDYEYKNQQYNDSLAKEKAAQEEYKKIKTQTKIDTSELLTYKKFFGHTAGGTCLAFSALFVISNMFKWLHAKNPIDGINDIDWFLKNYNLLNDWDEKSEIPGKDAAQIDILVSNLYQLQDDNGLLVINLQGQTKFGDYSYKGKDKKLLLTNAGNKTNFKSLIDGNAGYAKIKSIIQSMQGDGTGLGMIIALSHCAALDGHAVAIYRDPKYQLLL